MQGLDLTLVADELYALSPDDFRAARDERAAQARASGEKDLARAIAALRRPVVSAWLVNLLAREAAGPLAELLALGESLREAQRDLAGDRLRELSAQRGQLVAALISEAKRLAARDGRPVSPQVEREVEVTLSAALADSGAAAEVSAGRLASPLAYAGLGVGEAAAPAAPARPAAREGRQARAAAAQTKHDAERKAPATPAPRPETGTRRDAAQRDADRAAQREAREAAREAAAAERKAQEAAAVRLAVQNAADAVAAARADLDEAERKAAGARTEQETQRRRAEQLDRELAKALAEESRANRTARDAQRSREAAVRALDAATKRLARAEQAAGKLGAD